MLSDRHCRLLTALLDGQLGPRQHKAALRLLRRSSEARTLLRQLQADSQALRSLPPHALPADFSSRVMRVAAERGLRPGGPRPLPRPVGVPAWVGVAAAAAVLLAVTAGSFVYFRGEQPPPEGFAIGPPNVQFPDKSLAPRDRLPLDALAQAPARTRLEKELRKAPAFHLDLAVDNTSRTVEQLRTAFRKSGVQMHIDPRARASLGKKQPKMTYVVYAEDIRPDELAAILDQVGRADARDPSARRGASVLLNPLSGEDRTHLAKLLGVPSARLQPPNVPPIPLHNPPIFVPKDQQGKADKTAMPAPKEAGGFAVVLALDGADNQGAIRNFLNHRQPHRPGALQVYLVLHETNV